MRSKICVQQKHCHVAANAVALACDTGERFDHSLAKAGLKRIQLQHIRPCREVRVASASKDIPLYLNVGGRVVPDVVSIPPNEVFGMLDGPGMSGLHG